jgi:hypothetical protein
MTVAFQAKIENNAIAIPNIYRELITDKMFVTVSFTEDEKTIKYTAEKGTKRLLPPHINTNGWKFNREEANER